MGLDSLLQLAFTKQQHANKLTLHAWYVRERSGPVHPPPILTENVNLLTQPIQLAHDKSMLPPAPSSKYFITSP